jgi:hypothetical protein
MARRLARVSPSSRGESPCFGPGECQRSGRPSQWTVRIVRPSRRPSGWARKTRIVDSADAILARVPQAPWFRAAEQPGPRETSQVAVADYLRSCGGRFSVRWASGWDEAARVARGLDHESSFWVAEDRSRIQALVAVRAAGRTEALAEVLHRLSVLGYDAVRPAAPDEELARVASGAALWTVSEAVTWAVVADLLEPLCNPFLPKLRLFELGHWPLGLWQGTIVVL